VSDAIARTPLLDSICSEFVVQLVALLCKSNQWRLSKGRDRVWYQSERRRIIAGHYLGALSGAPADVTRWRFSDATSCW